MSVVIVPGPEVTLAKKRFDEHWSCPVGCETWSRFMGHYTTSYDYEERKFHLWMDERQAHIIRLLNGPHYKTVLKAMAVQWREGVEHG